MTSPTPSTPKIEPSLDKNFFIWGNIVLMIGIPWLLTLSMAGLAVGDSIFPDWFEISLLGLPAIALVTWLQWIQPISPFSLWFIAKPVESLSESERRALTLISQQRNGWYVTGWIAIAVAIFMSGVFCKIYAASALSQVIAPFPDELRFFGVLWAEIFFLLSNVLLQSGVSALRVKLTADSELGSLTPFAPEKIKDSFTHIGWRSPQFLTGDPTGNQTDNRVDSPLAAISPETLTEAVTDPVEEQELEVNDLVENTLVENEAIDQLLEQEELQVSDVAENLEESEVAQELFDDSAELVIEEVSAEIKVDESLDLADNLTESVTEEIEPEEIAPELLSEVIVADEIESDLVSEETVVDEIESELVSEEIASEEIESEQLFSDDETQIEDFSQIDTLANLEISDSTPDEEIEEDLETVQELEIVEVIEELDISDYKQEIAEEIDEVTEDIAIAEISLEGTEVVDSTSSDFEDELDELIAFNLYVENILQDYLEESLDDATENLDDTNNDGVVDITELTATPETATAIAEEVVIAEEILEEGIPETVADQSTLEIPEQETDKNVSVVESQEELQSPQEPKQVAKYLVEEFLVDKYLARLEQLNNADKNNADKLPKDSSEKTNTNVIEPVEPKLDEFAGLDELIDGKTINKKPVTED
jgi:hypothetical protein